jgi:hypothetical protein
MAEFPQLHVGDRVLIYLDPSRWSTSGWLPGNVVRIDPYSDHRNFHWIELDLPAKTRQGANMSVVAVLNPKHLRPA